MERLLKRKGFTLIELLIVVMIIGILASIAYTKYADLIQKSKDASTKGSLGVIRSALSSYYGDNEGIYPSDDLSSLTVNGKYLNQMPETVLPGTPHSSGSSVHTASSLSDYISDEGGWAYINNSSDSHWGDITVNCSHTDSYGRIWSIY